MTIHELSSVNELKGLVHGDVITRDDPGFEAARKVYNAMIDRNPLAVARCADVDDVIAVVNYTRERGLPLAVRGGGHSGGGLGTCDDGIVLDLSRMRNVRVDADARTALVDGGCTLADMDAATHPYGFAVPSGINSTTGIGGLTLGGGFGHLTRKHGLTIDNLLAVNMVLADGTYTTASATEHPDLFWAVRGGSGNFGVVTSFLFTLHPVSTVIGGPTIWPIEMSADVLRFYFDFLSNAPEELGGIFAIYTVPPWLPFPESLQLQKVCGITWCYTGTPEDAEELLAPVRAFGPPLLHGVKALPFLTLQAATDKLYPSGLQWYWRSDFLNDLSAEAINVLVECGVASPTAHSRIQIFPLGGAAGRVPKHETAFSYRDAKWSAVIVGVDPSPAKAELVKKWTVDTWDKLHPYSAGGAYVNFMMDEGQERVEATYRDNYARLAQIKSVYDPGNLFRINQNIRPT